MRLFAATSLLAIALAAVPVAMPLRAQEAPAPAPTPTPPPFRLPPSSTPTPSDVQGPVDPDAPILTRPRAPTPTPTPRATATPTPAPRPTAAPTRSIEPPRSSTLPPRFTPPAAPTPRESAAAEAGAEQILPQFPSASASAPAPLPVPGAAPSAAPAEPGEESGGWWLYALGGLVLAGGAGAALWRRRRAIADAPVGAIEPPRIVPPKPAADDARVPAVAPAPVVPAQETGSPLLIEARAVKLSRTMMYATLSYELVATNRSGQPLEGVRLGGDLVTAHARVPTEQQLADPAVPLAPMQDIARLDPGESAQLAGELRLPVNEIRPIPHGKAVIYVPLLRVRAEAAGMAPVARTFLVGLVPPGVGQRLQPFRLDEMPQTYSAVGQRALD